MASAVVINHVTAVAHEQVLFHLVRIIDNLHSNYLLSFIQLNYQLLYIYYTLFYEIFRSEYQFVFYIFSELMAVHWDMMVQPVCGAATQAYREHIAHGASGMARHCGEIDIFCIFLKVCRQVIPDIPYRVGFIRDEMLTDV